MSTRESYRIIELEEGVWIQGPAWLDADILPAEFHEAMATQDDFHPLRVIGNLKFTNTDDQSQTWFTFEPPVQLQVRFTCTDVQRALRRGKPLVLAYWAGDRWLRFPEGYQRFREEEVTAGFAYFEVREIGDPTICWGT